NWEYSVKQCAEHLYIVLLETFPEIGGPFIVNFVQKILKETYGSFDKQKILLRDSAYAAIGWGVFDLYEKINFVEWYKTDLQKEIEIKDARYKIIRRRVGWLLERWVEKIDRQTRRDTFKSLITLLYDEDLVLQLTAIKSIKSCNIFYVFNDF